MDNSKPILAIIIEALLKGGLASLEGATGQVEEAKEPEESLAEKLTHAQQEIAEVKSRLDSQPRSNLSDNAREFENTDTLKKNSVTDLQNQFEKPEIEIEQISNDQDQEQPESSSRRERLELQAQSEVQQAENERSESKKSKFEVKRNRRAVGE